MRLTLAAVAALVMVFGFHTDISMGLIIGAIVWAFIPAPAATRLVYVFNPQTGENRLQPMDKATQKYLQTRD